MNHSIWILPGISGFSIQMVNAHRHDWCTIIMGCSIFYPHLPPPPPLPKDDWHPHPRIFVGPYEKLNPKSSFSVSTIDTFVHRGWVIWPPSLEWERGGGGEGGGEELTSPFSLEFLLYILICLLIMPRNVLIILLWNKPLNSIFLHPGSCTRSKPSRLMHIRNTARFINWT